MSADFPGSFQIPLEYNQLHYTSSRNGDTRIHEGGARNDWSSAGVPTPVSLTQRSEIRDFGYESPVASETRAERKHPQAENWVPNVAPDSEDGCGEL